MKECIEEWENVEINENENIIELWNPCEFDINEKYEYIPKSKIFCITSNFIYYVIAYPVLKILTKIVYDLKIEGKENLENLKSGAISVSNHVLFLDCAMIGLAFREKPIYYTTQEESFKIPLVRKLIKLLRAIPIPKSINNKKQFVMEIEKLLKEKKIIHIYPEASLWPYYDKIRNFKNGAFNLAVKNNVPIIPCVVKFRKPKGIRKLFKRKQDVTLKILKPIYAKKEENAKEQIEKLKKQVYSEMKNILN